MHPSRIGTRLDDEILDPQLRLRVKVNLAERAGGRLRNQRFHPVARREAVHLDSNRIHAVCHGRGNRKFGGCTGVVRVADPPSVHIERIAPSHPLDMQEQVAVEPQVRNLDLGAVLHQRNLGRQLRRHEPFERRGSRHGSRVRQLGLLPQGGRERGQIEVALSSRGRRRMAHPPLALEGHVMGGPGGIAGLGLLAGRIADEFGPGVGLALRGDRRIGPKAFRRILGTERTEPQQAQHGQANGSFHGIANRNPCVSVFLFMLSAVRRSRDVKHDNGNAASPGSGRYFWRKKI